MRLWQTASKESNDWSSCGVSEFGMDPAPGINKQCWCEPKPDYMPNRCADEGEDCLCKGTVLFGIKKSILSPGKIADFDEFIEEEWAAEYINNTNSVACVSATFNGADPLPNGDKQCYCDNDKKSIDQASVIASKKFWKGQMLEEDALRQLTFTNQEVADADEQLATFTSTVISTNSEKIPVTTGKCSTCTTTEIDEVYQKSKKTLTASKTAR